MAPEQLARITDPNVRQAVMLMEEAAALLTRADLEFCFAYEVVVPSGIGLHRHCSDLAGENAELHDRELCLLFAKLFGAAGFEEGILENPSATYVHDIDKEPGKAN